METEKRNTRARQAYSRKVATLKKQSTRAREKRLRALGKLNVIAGLRTHLGMTLIDFAKVIGVGGPQEAYRVEHTISPGFKYVQRAVKYCRKQQIELDEKALFD